MYREGRRCASGLQVWASDVEKTFLDEPTLAVKNNVYEGRKYQRIIRDIPSFKAPLLDAHDAVFEE